MNATASLQQARRLAGTAQVLAIVALVTIVVAILLRGGVSLGVSLFTSQVEWSERLQSIGLVLVTMLPAMLLFEAVNRLRQALALYAQGDFFSSQASHHVSRSGVLATQALVVMIAVVPNLTLWLTDHGGFTLRIEPEYLGLLAFSLFVASVGRILDEAAQIKAENDAFI